jgi:hypothetical protein
VAIQVAQHEPAAVCEHDSGPTTALTVRAIDPHRHVALRPGNGAVINAGHVAEVGDGKPPPDQHRPRLLGGHRLDRGELIVGVLHELVNAVVHDRQP